ncbi:glycosyltransferase family 39 protein [Gimesia sp.]|uniref:ArnT family glycosyltransferase n=1 Tax=Gimesia sp. TaxID=2024833 RepID=UPI0025BD14F0|nr:glycosyltransferase family 39 protein [Gimesia sp.]
MKQHKPSPDASIKRRPAAMLWYLLLAGLSLLLVSSQLDCADDLSFTGPGPGMTVDEPFNVGQGVFLVRAMRAYGLGILAPESLREIFEHPNYLPDHPPLGRFLIGLSHETVATFAGDESRPFVVTYGRYASAVCFACLVFLVGWFTFLRTGHQGALIAAASLLALPRLFGHAHLAALEMPTALFYVLAVLAVVQFWDMQQAPSKKRACLTGILLGLALLTKIQAVLIPIPVIVWAIWKWRQQALLPLFCWGGVGVLVFFLGWPWLWFDPAGHLSEYLGRTTGRAALYVQYFGTKYADRDLPWHYAWVMLLTTVPVGLLICSSFGVTKLWRDFKTDQQKRPTGELLLFLSLLWPLILFTLPGITVYDGVRLFLMVFPLLAILIGLGAAIEMNWFTRRFGQRVAIIAVTLLMLSQFTGSLLYAPCWLSYYSLLTGGLNGADQMGMEATYWGDSLTAELLAEVTQEVPANSIIQIAPILHPAWLQMLQETPELQRKGIQLVPFESERPVSPYVLYFQRNPYLPELLQTQSSDKWTVVKEVTRQQVPLGRLVSLKDGR